MNNYSNDFEARYATYLALGGEPREFANIFECDLAILEIIQQGIGGDFKTNHYMDADGRLIVERGTDGRTVISDEHENPIIERLADGTTKIFDAYQGERMTISAHGEITFQELTALENQVANNTAAIAAISISGGASTAEAVAFSDGESLATKAEKWTKKVRVDIVPNGNSYKFMLGEEELNFADLNSMLQESPDFVVFVHDNREHRCVRIELGDNYQYMEFISPIIEGVYTKAQSFLVSSTNSTTISSVKRTDIVNENASNKSNTFDVANPEVKYPTISAVNDAISPLSDKITELTGDKSEIDLSTLTAYKGVMSTYDTTYSGANETLYQHKYISVKANDKFILTSNGVGTTVYAFVKSTGVTSDTIDLASGNIKEPLNVGESKEIVAPSDAVYLCVNSLYNGQDRAPIVRKNNEGEVNEIKSDVDAIKTSMALRYDTTQSLTNIQKSTALSNLGVETPNNLIDLFKIEGGDEKVIQVSPTKTLSGWFIQSSGVKAQNANYSIIVFNVEGLSNVLLKGTNNLNIEDNPRAYAFYAEEDCITKIGDVGERIQPQSYEYNLDVPQGAKYLGCGINTARQGDVDVFTTILVNATKIEKIVSDIDALKNGDYGMYKDGSDYYHFCKNGNKTIIRKFKQEGGNNLFQLSQIGLGTVNESGVIMSEIIQTCGTDNVGPVSLYNTSLFSGYGEWTGGYHTKAISGVQYPTAHQESLVVSVGGTPVTEDGLYFGKVHFQAVNYLYFPQSITGSDLSQATQALTETRDYICDDKMTVKVKMHAEKTFYVSCYYGMQAVTIGFNNIFLPNNGKEFTIASLTDTLWLTKPERKFYMNTGNMHYDLTLNDVGCGQFDTNAKLFGMFANGRNKAYFMCYQDAAKAKTIDSSQSAKKINEGDYFGWEGIYDIYFD